MIIFSLSQILDQLDQLRSTSIKKFGLSISLSCYFVGLYRDR